MVDSLTLITDDYNDQILFFLCGHYMCLRNIQTGQTDYSQIPQNADNIHSMAISPDR